MNKNNRKNIGIIVGSLAFLTPFLASAALQGLEDFFKSLRILLNVAIYHIVGLAVIYFLWGMGQFILKDAGNDKTREDGKKKMLWGIITLFVMVSLFGILNFISKTLDIPINSAL